MATETRSNQKERTRRAIVKACRELMRRDQPVTMPEVANAALVSEATAYRYFPDLASLLAKALAEDWPSPEDALAPVLASRDPVERVTFATRFLLEGVAARQRGVRAMIAATATHPHSAGNARPGIRFRLIDLALAPFTEAAAAEDQIRLDQLKRDLAIVVSADALFILTDQCALTEADAIESAGRTATTLTKAAFSGVITKAKPTWK